MARVVYVDRGLKKILANVSRAAGLRVQVGFVGPKGAAPHGDGRLSNAQTAIINEYGTDDGHIPARHAVREAAARNKSAIKGALAQAANQILTAEGWAAEFGRKFAFGSASAEEVLDAAGEHIAKKFSEEIASGEDFPPPNAQATIDRKSGNHPMVDTGELAKAVSHRVVREGGDILDAGSSAGEYEGFSVTGGGPA